MRTSKGSAHVWSYGVHLVKAVSIAANACIHYPNKHSAEEWLFLPHCAQWHLLSTWREWVSNHLSEPGMCCCRGNPSAYHLPSSRCFLQELRNDITASSRGLMTALKMWSVFSWLKISVFSGSFWLHVAALFPTVAVSIIGHGIFVVWHWNLRL